MAGPLDGLTIFDMTHAAVGPWATMLLGGMGANIIKIEAPPLGDLQQRIPPRQHDVPIIYSHCNLGKRSALLDLKDQGDREKAYTILKYADVCIHNMRPGAAGRLGFDYDTVQRINPKIIYVDSSAWGPRGPLGMDSGADGPVQAFSGFTSLNGPATGPGEYMRAYGYIDINTSQVVAMSVLEAVLRRARTGETQHVEVTMLGASMLMQATRIAEYLSDGVPPPRLGSASRNIVPDQAFQCQDNEYLTVSVLDDTQWQRFTKALGSEDLGSDKRFRSNLSRVNHRAEVVPAIEAIFQTKPRRWWEIKLKQADIAYGRPMDFEQLMHHPQVQENQFVIPIDVPHANGKMIFGNLPWRFTESTLKLGPPPFSGKHTTEILSEYVDQNPDPQVETLGKEIIDGTLEGITVLDGTRGYCGPFAGMILAEMGATVIKIERPRGDRSLAYGPPIIDGQPAVYFHLNRLKKLRTLDLLSPQGIDDYTSLAKSADIILDDLPPGEAAGRNIDYENLRVGNPGLIYCAISNFGENGPQTQRPASDLTIQAMTACLSAIGKVGDPPVRLGADVASASTGMHAVQSILAALYQRRKSGQGQKVSVSLFGSILHMRGIIWTSQFRPDEWIGHTTEHSVQPIDNGYQTKDLPVFFTLGRRISQEQYEDFMRALGMEDAMSDPRFANKAELAIGTRIFAHQVKPMWDKALSKISSQEFIDLVRGFGGEAERLNDYPALFAHEQAAAINALAKVDDPKFGEIRVLTLPWRLRGSRHASG